MSDIPTTTRRITRSQALLGDDGSAALGLWFDDGEPVAGWVDQATIRALRRQLDRLEAFLEGTIPPAQ